jgi:tetratricopeptide (TPR) repeat protein
MRARAEALIVAGHAALQISNNELAAVRFQEGEVLYSKLGDQRRQAWALRGSGFTCFIQGDLADAQTFLEKSLNICREIQSEWCLAWSLYELGNIAFARGDLAQAESLFDGAMGLFRQHGRELGTFRTLISQGHLRRAQGKWAQAKAFYKEALEIQQETNYIQFIAQILEGLAYLAVADDDLETAVQLLGAAQARRDSIEMTRWAHQEIEYQHNLEISRYQLPPTVWQAMWKKGYNLAPQDALEFANT